MGAFPIPVPYSSSALVRDTVADTVAGPAENADKKSGSPTDKIRENRKKRERERARARKARREAMRGNR